MTFAKELSQVSKEVNRMRAHNKSEYTKALYPKIKKALHKLAKQGYTSCSLYKIPTYMSWFNMPRKDLCSSTLRKLLKEDGFHMGGGVVNGDVSWDKYHLDKLKR